MLGQKQTALARFNSEIYGSLNIWSDEKGKEYFRAIDICAALRLTNASQAISRYVDSDYVIQIDDGTNRAGKTNYLSEPGLYQLIFASKTEWAKQFQRWVFEEVLPKLRASGGYIKPSTTSKELDALREEHLKDLAENKLLKESIQQAQLEAKRSSELTQKFVNYLSDLNRFALEMRLGVGFYKVENLNLKENMHHIFNRIQSALSFINQHKQTIDDIDAFTCSYDTTQNSDYASEYVQLLLEHIEKREAHRKN